MEWTIEFGGPDAPDVTVTLAGAANLAGFAAYSEALMSDFRFHAGMSVLIDGSDLDTTPMSADAMMEAISTEITRRDWIHPPRAVAVVARDEEAAARQRLMRAHLGGVRSRREVFLSREEAVAWLTERH